MQPFFSIIIPIYNGLTLGLPRCLQRIWEQPLEESIYEVICVDDCSTDGTRVWLQDEAKKHANLKLVFNKDNVRQGGSRNNGVKTAKGKYILFIDQDDYYHKDSLCVLYNHLKNSDLDVLISDSTYQFGDREHNRLQLNSPYRSVTDGQNYLMQNGIVISPWRFAILRDFFIRHNLYFVESKRTEDVDWALKVLFYAHKIQYLPHILIHYIKGEKSTTDNMYRDYQTQKDCIDAGNRVCELANSLYKSSIAKEVVIDVACSSYYVSTKYMFGIWCPISKKKEIISSIPNMPENKKLVKFAKNYPTIYSITTNLCVPLFRMARRIHRYRAAKKMAK